MSEKKDVYLEYVLSDNRQVWLRFGNLNDRDGCHISLDMYKINIGPVTPQVVERTADKFSGEIVTSF